MIQLDTLLTQKAPLPTDVLHDEILDTDAVAFAQVWSEQAIDVPPQDKSAFPVTEAEIGESVDAIAIVKSDENAAPADPDVSTVTDPERLVKTAPDPLLPRVVLHPENAQPVRQNAGVGEREQSSMAERKAALGLEAGKGLPLVANPVIKNHIINMVPEDLSAGTPQNTLPLPPSLAPQTVRHDSNVSAFLWMKSPDVRLLVKQMEQSLPAKKIEEPRLVPVNQSPQLAGQYRQYTSISPAPMVAFFQKSAVSPLHGPLSDSHAVPDLVPNVSPHSANAPSPHNNSVAPRHYAPPVTTQIATAIVQSSGATTEIALNPEELGRVRIALVSGEAGLSVSIMAERSETAELMRRNIEQLARDLRDLGFENPTFTFGDQSSDPQQEQSDDSAQTSSDHPLGSQEQPNTHLRVALAGGLDLKL